MNLWTTITSTFKSKEKQTLPVYIPPHDPLQIQDKFSDIISKKDFEEYQDYKLLLKLGKGSVGTVYKAVHLQSKQEVAMKLIPTRNMKNEKSL
ncbi:MAG TPA: hypothetical protein PLR86_10895, partial [Planctomycetota bacterium]|nr:hypothetical protein [Planctomycetota bacterium]